MRMSRCWKRSADRWRWLVWCERATVEGAGCIGRNRCGVYGCPIASRGVIVAVTVVLEWFVNPLVKSTLTLVIYFSTPLYLVEVCSLVVL